MPIPRGHTNHFGRRYKGWLGLDWGVAIEIRHIAKQKPNRAAATSSTSHWPHPQQPRGGGGGGDLLKLPPFGCNPSTCFGFDLGATVATNTANNRARNWHGWVKERVLAFFFSKRRW